MQESFRINRVIDLFNNHNFIYTSCLSIVESRGNTGITAANMNIKTTENIISTNKKNLGNTKESNSVVKAALYMCVLRSDLNWGINSADKRVSLDDLRQRARP